MIRIKEIIDENNRFKNFSEEVIILKETKAGDNYSLYSVKNKNNVTFQVVSGQAGMKGKGFMGFVNGDRGRPTVWGFAAETTNIEVNGNEPFNGWNNTNTVNFNFNPVKTNDWDITLEVTATEGTLSKQVAKSVTTLIL